MYYHCVAWDLTSEGTRYIYRHTCRQNTRTHKNHNNKKQSKLLPGSNLGPHACKMTTELYIASGLYLLHFLKVVLKLVFNIIHQVKQIAPWLPESQNCSLNMPPTLTQKKPYCPPQCLRLQQPLIYFVSFNLPILRTSHGGTIACVILCD